MSDKLGNFLNSIVSEESLMDILRNHHNKNNEKVMQITIGNKYTSTINI